jgi:hypothetical protein
MSITLLYWTTIGLGKHIFMSTPANLKTGLIILYANYCFWNIGTTLTRIFKVNQQFRIALWIVAGLNIAWEIFAVLSATFQ